MIGFLKDLREKRDGSFLVVAIAYSMPSVGMALIQVPVNTVLGGVYAKYYGFTLTSIAFVVLIAKVFDGITDPIIGCCSDYWRARTGSRKSFMLLGALALVPSCYFLFVPDSDAGLMYFTICYLLFYLSFTVFAISYLAWINEFTITSKEKTLVFSFNSIFLQLGGGIFYFLPLLPFSSSAEISPRVLQYSAITGSFLLLSGLFVALKLVPDGLSRTPLSVTKGFSFYPAHVLDVLKSIIRNKPFIIFIFAFTFLGVGTGMWVGMFFIYVDSYLKLGESFTKISLWGMLFGALAIPFWYRLSIILGKRKAWLIGMAILLCVFVATSLLEPGDSDLYGLFFLNILMLFSAASMGVLAGPMLCDAIDYGRLKDHAERNAVYFSIFTLLSKMQAAIGGALGMAIAGWFGFDVLSSGQGASALVGLHLAVAWLPAIFVGLAMIFIAFMPLNEERMEVIRKRLTARDGRIESNEN